ncbi:MAG: hypothetical protein F4Z35_00640 [Dehalococcoidia bacterium]|nr:hypothetical protein [Dehalococcoidia bacterium]
MREPHRPVRSPEPSPCVLIPIPRVIILSILSAGQYFYYWAYITWKHYRDQTGETAYPLWHALAFMIPVYGYYRVHAHMRVYGELMLDHGMKTSINPVRAVFTVIIAVGLLETTILNFWKQTIYDPIVLFSFVVISATTIMWLLASTQNNINRYWESALFTKSPIRVRIGIGEVIFVVVGLLMWTHTALIMFSGYYRYQTGFGYGGFW